MAILANKNGRITAYLYVFLFTKHSNLIEFFIGFITINYKIGKVEISSDEKRFL